MLSQSKQIAMTEKYELLDKHSHILIIMFCICISTTFQITVQSVSIERLHKCWHVRISFFLLLADVTKRYTSYSIVVGCKAENTL